MRFFIDTANIKEIKEVFDMGVIGGVTTNPSIIAKEGKEFTAAINEIKAIVGDETYIFGEVIALDAPGMIEEGRKLAKLHKKFVVKIPLCAEGLKAVKTLNKEGIKTCTTLCFSATQALMAANAGATFVAPFVGRVDDIGWNGTDLIRDIMEIFDVQGIETQLVVASTRNPIHIIEIAKAGAHIATVPYPIFAQMVNHPLTTMGLEKFLKDWEKVPKK